MLEDILEKDESTKDRKDDSLSFSDQKIVIRQMPDSVTVEFGGEKLRVKPPSHFILKLIKEQWTKFHHALLNRLDLARELDDYGKKYQDVPKAQAKKAAKEMADKLKALADQQSEISKAQNEFTYRAVRLIVLECKHPNWKKDYDSIPEDDDDIWEKSVSMEYLDKFVSAAEILRLLDVYDQLNSMGEILGKFQRLGSSV